MKSTCISPRVCSNVDVDHLLSLGNLKILKRLRVFYTILQTRFILVIQSVWNKIEDSNTVSGIEASKQVKSPSFLKWQCTPTHNGMLGKFKNMKGIAWRS